MSMEFRKFLIISLLVFSYIYFPFFLKANKKNWNTKQKKKCLYNRGLMTSVIIALH